MQAYARNESLFRERVAAAALKMSTLGQPTMDGSFSRDACTARPSSLSSLGGTPLTLRITPVNKTCFTVDWSAVVLRRTTGGRAPAAPQTFDKLEFQIGRAAVRMRNSYHME